MSLPSSRSKNKSNEKLAKSKHEVELFSLSVSYWFIVGLFIYPEDGGIMFSETLFNFQQAIRRYDPVDRTLLE
jgi:hypothetical protein